MRSPPSARFTDSTETGRFTASGCTLSGKATVALRGNTGSSGGSGGMVAVGSLMTSLLVFHRNYTGPSTRVREPTGLSSTIRGVGRRCSRRRAHSLRLVSCAHGIAGTRLLHRETGDAGGELRLSTMWPPQRLPGAVGAPHQEGSHPLGRRRAGSRDVHKTQGLSRARRRHLDVQDVPAEVRHPVAALDHVRGGHPDGAAGGRLRRVIRNSESGTRNEFGVRNSE